LIQHLLVARHLLLASLVGDALPGAARLFGHSHARAGSQRTNRFGKTGPGMFDQEGDGATMRPTTKTVIELLAGAYCERGAFFVVKGAQAKQIGPALTQLHISPDDIDNINSGEKF